MQLRSDRDRGDGTSRYVLSGEGAGTIFRIDEKSGDLHATQRLDREEKASYILQAQAFNKITGLPLEPATEFIVKIHDINDNEPTFTKAVYAASVPEMSDVGEWMKITFSPSVVIWSAFTVMLEYCTRVWYSCHCSVFKVMDGSVPLVFPEFLFFFFYFNFDKYVEHVVLRSGSFRQQWARLLQRFVLFACFIRVVLFQLWFKYLSFPKINFLGLFWLWFKSLSCLPIMLFNTL